MGDTEQQPEQPQPDAPADEQPLPADSPSVLNYLSPSSESLVTLRTLPQVEAEMAKAKLESEGIACCIEGANLSAMHPLLFNEVRLKVQQLDRPRAEAVLARPADSDSEGEYVDENWRCPKCHQKTLQLLPLTLAQARLRLTWILVLLAPLPVWLIRWAAQDTAIEEWFARFGGILAFAWLILAAVLGTITILAHREKRCTQCSWRSDLKQ